MSADDIRRQSAMILAGHPRGVAPEDRLLSETPRKSEFLNKWRAMADRLVMQELRYEQADDRPDWLKRWVG